MHKLIRALRVSIQVRSTKIWYINIIGTTFGKKSTILFTMLSLNY